MQIKRATLLWWLAFVAEMIAAVLETVDGDYTKAIGLYLMSLAFLILALSKGSTQGAWRKYVLVILFACGHRPVDPSSCFAAAHLKLTELT